MSGRRSKTKGKRGERRAARILREALGLTDEIHRTDQGWGATGPDVDGSPWWVEAKEQLRPNIWKALEQAQENSRAANDPRPTLVIAHRTQRTGVKGQTVVVMEPAVFIALVQASRGVAPTED